MPNIMIATAGSSGSLSAYSPTPETGARPGLGIRQKTFGDTGVIGHRLSGRMSYPTEADTSSLYYPIQIIEGTLDIAATFEKPPILGIAERASFKSPKTHKELKTARGF